MPPEQSLPSPILTDRFNRHVDYVRLSVTDRCDFRCLYCMGEDVQFLPRAEILTLEELLTLGRAFVALGVRRIRITGGNRWCGATCCGCWSGCPPCRGSMNSR